MGISATATEEAAAGLPVSAIVAVAVAIVAAFLIVTAVAVIQNRPSPSSRNATSTDEEIGVENGESSPPSQAFPTKQGQQENAGDGPDQLLKEGQTETDFVSEST